MTTTIAMVRSRYALGRDFLAMTLIAFLVVVGGCTTANVRTVDAELARQGAGPARGQRQPGILYTRAVLGVAASVVLMVLIVNDWNDAWDWDFSSKGR